MSNTLTTPRLSRERRTIAKMIALYCRDHHRSDDSRAPRSAAEGELLCDRCAELLDYAEARLARCPYGEEKPACTHCPVHCYKPDPRAQVKAVMRYAGPRMLLRHPFLAIAHLIDELRGRPEKPTGRGRRA